MKRYEDYFDMISSTKEEDIPQYMSVCLEDYADFIESTGIAISINDFISKCWNVIPYYNFIKLKSPDKLYIYLMDMMEVCMVCEFPFSSMDKERTIVVAERLYICNNDDTITIYAGMAYFSDSRYDVPYDIKSIRKDDSKCQQMKAVLITKTNQLQS